MTVTVLIAREAATLVEKARAAMDEALARDIMG